MKSIRVLHVDSEKGYGGGQRQLTFLLKSGKENGLIQAVACRDNSEIKNIATSLNIKTFDINQANSIDIISSYKLKKIIDIFKPVIVHTHTSKSLAISFLQKILFKSKYRAIYLNTRRVSFPLSGWFTKKKYLHGADVHICVSKSTMNQLIAFGINTDKLVVIHSGIQIPKRIDKTSDRGEILKLTGFSYNNLIIGSSGNLLPVKRFDWLIRAIKNVKKDIPNIKLVIFGDGQKMNDLTLLIQSLNIKDSVCLAGHKTDPEGFFSGLDIFCMTSELEGLSGSLMDAMVREVPLLGSNTSGINDIIQHNENGLLFNVSSEQDLQEKLIELASSHSLRIKLTKKSRNTAMEKFGIKSTTMQNINFYKKILTLKHQ